jgi:ubiquinone/menaquinone biosynthesis C-methylase UbiE
MGGQVGVIHAAAARGFPLVPDAYERGRPMYPFAAVRRLVRELGIRPEKRVLDLAAGTGKLTRLLAQSGAEVVAVEPVDAMRERLVETVAGIRAMRGTAEAIPLPDASMDAVTVGQAFHWFDGDAALAEIHRVLRPGRRLGLIWNVKDESVDWVRLLAEIVESYRGSAPRVASGAWKDAFERTELFTPIERARFSFVHEVDAEIVVARVTSISFIAALDATVRERVVEQVRELVATHPETRERRVFPLRYRTGVYWCDRI